MIWKGVVGRVSEKKTSTGKDIYFVTVVDNDMNEVGTASGFGHSPYEEGESVELEIVQKGEYFNIVQRKPERPSGFGTGGYSKPPQTRDALESNREYWEMRRRQEAAMNVNNFLGRLCEQDPAPFEEKELKCRKAFDFWFRLTVSGGQHD
jgi:hypothetical protein